MRPMTCRSSGPLWSVISRLRRRMLWRLAAVQSARSVTSSGCSGTYRSFRSLPSGIRSQCPAPICTTASASRSASSPARMPVRASSSTTSRSRGSLLARAAVMSLAASRSPGELRQRLGLLGDVPGDDRVAGWGVGPVPLDDALEELPDGPHPLPVCLSRNRRAAGSWPGSQPHLVVLDVVAVHRADAVQPGVGDQPAGELAQRVLGRVDAARCQERAELPQVAAHEPSHQGRGGLDLGPFRRGGAAGHGPAASRRGGRLGSHRAASSCAASISLTAAVSASMSAAARRYSPASQSLVRCR